jgi:hypothetical protein
MKTILSIRLVYQGQTKAMARKEIESSMVPFPGLIIEDTAWDVGSEVKGVSYIVDDDSYYVTLSTDNLEAESVVESTKESYKGHGWTIVGE